MIRTDLFIICHKNLIIMSLQIVSCPEDNHQATKLKPSISSHSKPCLFLFVCNRGDTMHYWTRTNYGALLHSSMSTTDNTTQYHGKHPIKGVMPSLVWCLIRGLSNILFWLHCVVKQNIWEDSYETSYEALNDKKYWALECVYCNYSPLPSPAQIKVCII